MSGRHYERDRRGLIVPGLIMVVGLAVLGLALVPLPTHGSPVPQASPPCALDGAADSSQPGKPQQLHLDIGSSGSAPADASDAASGDTSTASTPDEPGPEPTPQPRIIAAVPDEALPVTHLQPITGSTSKSASQPSSAPVQLQVALVAESPDLADVAQHVASLIRNDRVTASATTLDGLQRPDVVLLLDDSPDGSSVWYCDPSTNASQQLATSLLKALAPLPSEPDGLDVTDTLPCDSLYTGRAQMAAALVRLPADTPDFDSPQVLAGAVKAYLNANASAIQNSRSASRLVWPAYGPITSYYGPSHPLGIDIGQSTGDIVAATDGTITFAGGDPCCSYGNYVIIDSPAGIRTLYAHFSAIYVKQGQQVKAGAGPGSRRLHRTLHRQPPALRDHRQRRTRRPDVAPAVDAAKSSFSYQCPEV